VPAPWTAASRFNHSLGNKPTAIKAKTAAKPIRFDTTIIDIMFAKIFTIGAWKGCDWKVDWSLASPHHSREGEMRNKKPQPRGRVGGYELWITPFHHASSKFCTSL
jgi:hypothetical protein